MLHPKSDNCAAVAHQIELLDDPPDEPVDEPPDDPADEPLEGLAAGAVAAWVPVAIPPFADNMPAPRELGFGMPIQVWESDSPVTALQPLAAKEAQLLMYPQELLAAAKLVRLV